MVSKEILAISLSSPLWIEWYFRIIGFLMDHDELAKAEEFLELIEAWPEEAFTKQNQRTKKET